MIFFVRCIGGVREGATTPLVWGMEGGWSPRKKKLVVFASVFSGFQHTIFSFGGFVVHKQICGLARGFIIPIKELGL
jgi:hypothetical protein